MSDPPETMADSSCGVVVSGPGEFRKMTTMTAIAANTTMPPPQKDQFIFPDFLGSLDLFLR